MMDGETLREVLSYLRAVAPQYPGGIPEEYIVAPSVEAVADPAPRAGPVCWGAPRARLAFVGSVSPYGAGFGAEADQLLSAAIEKGMRLRREAVMFVNVPRPHSADVAANLAADLAAAGVEIAVVLGDSAAAHSGVDAGRSSWYERGTVRFLKTHTVERVLSDPAAKREFWSDLQQVMRRLENGAGA